MTAFRSLQALRDYVAAVKATHKSEIPPIVRDEINRAAIRQAELLEDRCRERDRERAYALVAEIRGA